MGGYNPRTLSACVKNIHFRGESGGGYKDYHNLWHYLLVIFDFYLIVQNPWLSQFYIIILSFAIIRSFMLFISDFIQFDFVF